MSFESNHNQTEQNSTNMPGDASNVENSTSAAGGQADKGRKPKAKRAANKTVFTSVPLLNKQAKAASTAQIRSTFEALEKILNEREAADEEAARIEKEQTEIAERIIKQAKESGVPLDLLKKVMNS